MNLSNRDTLFDGVNMPLVNSEEVLFDPILSKSVSDQFNISKNGQIIDQTGNFWMIWGIVELERWWNIFESTVGIPFGRKLFNSCCDEEEYQLSHSGLLGKGLFKNKKNRTKLINRWQNFGWGDLDINNTKIDTSLPSTIAAGLAVAAVESYQDKRFKSEWRQKNSTEIFLDLKIDEREIPLAKKHIKLPWSINPIEIITDNITLELEKRPIGWSIEGELSVILPVSLFSRLFYSTIGINSSLTNDESNSWIIEGLEERFCQPLTIALHSIYRLFIDSDKHVFADGKESWNSLLNYYCSQWGWGGIDDLELDTNGEGISVKVRTSETLPFLIGRIVGIWQRSYGKKPKINIRFSHDYTTFKVESFLEYN